MSQTSRSTFRLFKLSSIYGFGKLSTKVFSFITTPILTRFLSIADYGTLGLLSVISGFLGYIYPMSAHVLIASDYAKLSRKYKKLLKKKKKKG